MSASTYDERRAPSATVDTIASVGPHTHRRISWAAIFGGVILIVAIQLLLSLLGAGIGLGTVDTNAGSTPSPSSLGVGAGIWWVVSSCIALVAGGYVAAWLAGIELRFDGMLHGLVAWGIATLLTFWLLTSAIGGLIGGGFSALSSVASAAGSGVSEAAKPIAQAAGVSPDMIQQQAQSYLQPTNPDPATMSPQDAQKEIADARPGRSGRQGRGRCECRGGFGDIFRGVWRVAARCDGSSVRRIDCGPAPTPDCPTYDSHRLGKHTWKPKFANCSEKS